MNNHLIIALFLKSFIFHLSTDIPINKEYEIYEQ